MKKIFLLISLTVLLSCSKDDDSQDFVHIPNQTTITTWKLISITDDLGNEIANECELEHGKIIVESGLDSDNFFRTKATITDGKFENQTCDIITTNFTSWSRDNNSLYLSLPNGDRSFYEYLETFENEILYMSITLLYTEDRDSGIIDEEEELITYNYIRESIEF
ncbi:MAG TPA: hypothetical protein PLL09_15815 [Flavobacterium sp.]|uniref:hypothetical protein n=1 Tax=unclassified Flavobacterium TaxID=196869 RepID=UPI0025B88F0D|nr:MULTISPECIES: hypothetical protein [unclassified Flavobacterium]HRE79283.1 hypothetical protein [Flavobacterium sp.]